MARRFHPDNHYGGGTNEMMTMIPQDADSSNGNHWLHQKHKKW